MHQGPCIEVGLPLTVKSALEEGFHDIRAKLSYELGKERKKGTRKRVLKFPYVVLCLQALRQHASQLEAENLKLRRDLRLAQLAAKSAEAQVLEAQQARDKVRLQLEAVQNGGTIEDAEKVGLTFSCGCPRGSSLSSECQNRCVSD